MRLGTHDYPVLDLTSPDAVMDAAGNAVEDVAEELLGNLGDALATARVLIGLDPPPGHPTVPTISLADLLSDPLAAIAGYWQTLMTSHADAVNAVLLELRDAIADAGEIVGSVIHGTGTVRPIRGASRSPVRSSCRPGSSGRVVTIAIAASTSVDTLGQRCTVIETQIAAMLAEIDLGARTASLLTGASGRLTARERGVTPPRVTLVISEGVSISSGPVGVRLDWSVASGLSSAIEVPDLTLQIGDETIPVPLPVIEPDGSVSLDAAGWDAVEELIGRLAILIPGPVEDIVSLLGWTQRPFVTGAELRLADLVDDPAAALAAWLPQLALSELGPEALSFLADLFSAAGDVSGAIAGSGHPDDPYRLPIGAGLPEPAVWFPPEGLEPRVTAVPVALARWRPGDPGLSPESLEQALRAEGQVAADIADMVRGRSIAAGLAAITARWVGGDGRIAPPSTAPAGITIVRAGHAAGQLLPLIDLETELDRVPTTVVYVDIGSGAWADKPDGQRIDLTAPGLAPTMFTPPAAAAGEWFVALGTRAASKLPTGDADGTAGQAARLESGARQPGPARQRPRRRRPRRRRARRPRRRRRPDGGVRPAPASARRSGPSRSAPSPPNPQPTRCACCAACSRPPTTTTTTIPTTTTSRSAATSWRRSSGSATSPTLPPISARRPPIRPPCAPGSRSAPGSVWSPQRRWRERSPPSSPPASPSAPASATWNRSPHPPASTAASSSPSHRRRPEQCSSRATPA